MNCWKDMTDNQPEFEKTWTQLLKTTTTQNTFDKDSMVTDDFNIKTISFIELRHLKASESPMYKILYAEDQKGNQDHNASYKEFREASRKVIDREGLMQPSFMRYMWALTRDILA